MKKIRLYITKDIVGSKKEFYNFHYIKRLSEKYNIIYDPHTPEYVICNCNGSEYLKYDCIRIMVSGENLRVNFNLVDYAIGFDFMDFGDRYIRAPLFYTFFNPNVYRHIERDVKDALQKRNKFCSAVISNGGGNRILFRNLAFEKISKYKKIDSGGTWNNNIGYRISDKLAFLRDYKFNLCFENSSYPGYLTEKLFEAYICGCVPIYWGDTSLKCLNNLESKEDMKLTQVSFKTNTQNTPFMQPQGDNILPTQNIDTSIPKISSYLFEYKVNPKAFINAHNFPNLDSLVDEIRRVDVNNNLYLEMINQNLFLDNFKPFTYYENKIYNFLDSVFLQDYDNAFRRGNSAMLYIYNKRAKKSYKLDNIYRKIFHYPRDLIRKCRDK